jgi:hypothetical protein
MLQSFVFFICSNVAKPSTRHATSRMITSGNCLFRMSNASCPSQVLWKLQNYFFFISMRHYNSCSSSTIKIFFIIYCFRLYCKVKINGSTYGRFRTQIFPFDALYLFKWKVLNRFLQVFYILLGLIEFIKMASKSLLFIPFTVIVNLDFNHYLFDIM